MQSGLSYYRRSLLTHYLLHICQLLSTCRHDDQYYRRSIPLPIYSTSVSIYPHTAKTISVIEDQYSHTIYSTSVSFYPHAVKTLSIIEDQYSHTIYSTSISFYLRAVRTLSIMEDQYSHTIY